MTIFLSQHLTIFLCSHGIDIDRIIYRFTFHITIYLDKRLNDYILSYAKKWGQNSESQLYKVSRLAANIFTFLGLEKQYLTCLTESKLNFLFQIRWDVPLPDSVFSLVTLRKANTRNWILLLCFVKIYQHTTCQYLYWFPKNELTLV